MKQSRYQRGETDPLNDVRSLLQGTVFHVTRLRTLPSILADGEIRHNRDGSLSSGFGYNSFFRNRGYVSLFDYRAELSSAVQNYRDKCSPFQMARPPESGIAILFLNPLFYSALVPWSLWSDEAAHTEAVVPYVEAGYRESIRVEQIAEIVTLEIVEEPDCHMAVLREANRRRQRR